MIRFEKYLVLKKTDIENVLDKEELVFLDSIRAKIMVYRSKNHKSIQKNYVVVADTLPFYEETWKKIENYVENKKEKVV